MTNPDKKLRKKKNIFYVTRVGMLAAIAFVLMLFDFPLPIFPSFLQIDLSGIPVVIGTFAMGPGAGILIQFIKSFLHALIASSTPFAIGDLADFVVGGSYVLIAGFIYRYKKTRAGAVVSMTAGTITAVIVAGLFNYFFFIPVYSSLMNIDMSVVIQMGNAIVPQVTNLVTLVIYSIVPFNLLKWCVITIITSLIYKPLSPVFKMK